MNNILTVFKFEFTNQIKKKAFWITNIIMVVIILLLTSIPSIVSIFSNKSDGNLGQGEVIEDDTESIDDNLGYVDESLGYILVDDSVDKELLFDTEPFKYMKVVNSRDEIEKAIEDDSIDKGLSISDDELEIIVESEGITSNYSYIYDAFDEYKNKELLKENGIDFSLLDELHKENYQTKVTSLKKSSQANFAIGYVGVFIIYMLILMFGNSSALLVANEKSNRTMEILVTTTKPKYLILGKVFAGLAVSILQIFILGFALFLGIVINKSQYPIELINYILQNLSWDVILVFLLFSIFGFLLYLFIYAASGAMVSKIEDLNKAITPIQIIVVISFLVSYQGLYTNGGNLLKIASYVPFSSPMAMFLRYACFGVDSFEVITSFLILLLTNALIAILSIKIYRNASLKYGKKVSLIGEIKKVFKK